MTSSKDFKEVKYDSTLLSIPEDLHDLTLASSKGILEEPDAPDTEARFKKLQGQIARDRKQAKIDREQASKDRQEALNIKNEVEKTSELVRLGFIVIIVTAGGTVVAAIGMVIATSISLYGLWASQNGGDYEKNTPLSSCAVINPN